VPKGTGSGTEDEVAPATTFKQPWSGHLTCADAVGRSTARGVLDPIRHEHHAGRGRLCLQALLLTGEARYAGAMERTLHNALLGALQPDGHWWAYFLELEGDAAPSICQYPEIKTNCL